MRDYLLGVVIVPSLIIFLWHTLFGKTSLYLELAQMVGSGIQKSVNAQGYVGIIENVKINQSVAITSVIENLGFGDYASLAVYAIIFIAIIYYLTCADSAIWVMNNTISTIQNVSSAKNHLLWATLIAAFSMTVLINDGFDLFAPG